TAPNLMGELMAVVNASLPAPGGIGEKHALGKDSETALSQSFLAESTNRAAEHNNEIIR
ncbi:MAG: ketoacyl reductase, partial [Spirosoma sp.]|nr:ketoacyl reductase [Spirosoma sp.]